MDLASRHAQARRRLRRVLFAYCALVSAVGTLGGIIGFVGRENDQT